ncbi:RND family efflux transporter MFP subunit [Amycolatopsis mediterranei S699]|uniref:RND family efflux transporter MFP subunit n=1 Tax=Amycolatopsis mediterranei (strain U-32) TaxID=749927 RepID=A0A0H3CWA3_AMYMU|nr:HlyD family efflux transporter periplasmic adaptor subunit [Amycolatopsis mediterranei]ADJ42310.1 RND family efflux transporter MFP subunit [Amycolatopsis mediterranei U32]AFO74024.1 RND family efflux transporter MFP subunit [Amycolatopsis mediterranei S699]AGT81153.1 RND family efflux transporter MFP subunit [Amycolatopsis mediterranei RB]KDO09782.1 RND transporter [Amycolatopsis mediterranei]KDU86344.1 RND transporter [Amycolatopsis mediterranei]
MTRVRASKAWVINGALVVLLAGAGFGIYQAFTPEPSSAQAQSRSTPVRRATVTETVSAAGTLASSYTGAANFATAGKVTSIDVKVGDVVSAGQKLATVDSTQAAKQLQVAKANLAVAQNALNTAETAEATPATGQNSQNSQNAQNSAQAAANNVTSAQAKLDQAQLDVQTAQQTLDNTTLYAPGAGTVTAINGAVGQQSSSGSSATSQSSSSGSGQGGQGSSSNSGAAASSSSSSGSGFITITNLTGLVVNTSVAEIDVSKVKAGQKATVTLNALPDKPVQATVSSINLTPTTSGSVVSYGAQLALTSPPDGLRPGQSASVVITVAEADNALSVPAAAVQTVGSTNLVTVQENGQNVPRQVQVGLRGEATVQITSGLTEGENVVLTGTASTGATGGTGRTGGTGGFPGGGTGGFPGGGQRGTGTGTGTGAGGGFGGRG